MTTTHNTIHIVPDDIVIIISRVHAVPSINDQPTDVKSRQHDRRGKHGEPMETLMTREQTNTVEP